MRPIRIISIVEEDEEILVSGRFMKSFGKIIKDLDDIPQIKMEELKPFIKAPDFYSGKGFHIITA